jgi:dipeptidyl aminopeptidase/acylaminoacyl peptidase
MILGAVMKLFRFSVLVLLAVAGSGAAAAQGTVEDYRRAEELRTRYINLVPNIADEPNFSEDNKTLVYRRTLSGGGLEFIKVDLATLTKTPALDQETLAKGLSDAAKRPYDGKRLPFGRYTTSADGITITFETQAQRWRCKLADYACEKVEDVKRPPVYEGMGPRNPIGTGRPERPDSDPVKSPDGLLEAYVRDFNLWVRDAGARDGRQLSFDGSKQNFYVVTDESWSPDSKMLAVSRTRPGEERYVNYVESSPDGQLQPITTEMFYNKPGDVLTDRQPVLFDVATARATVIDRTLFPNAYSQSEPKWWKDGRGFYIRYNQRGHQAYRIIEVNRFGIPRAIIDEASKTYIEYNSKTVFEPLNDGREIVWMSERDGWCHLYLYDGVKGVVKKQITKGPWAVRAVQNIDQEKRTITFSANGMRNGEDPYFTHYYRINFDGTGLVPLTEGVGTHSLTFSPDRQFYVDTWSRVDMAPVAELRRASDGAKLMELDRGDMAPLLAAGWSAPEPFVAKGRDGVTDIYGLIVKPSNFDPSKKYPVIESIYAGPQGAFTPKSFASYRAMNGQAELGFIVVQMDGMGTNYRSKAFHDVAWKNLKDAGFPDRILWHKAAAAKYPWYDISRVGVYGGSAGGQNALGALLFHPEFYDAAFAFAGSHDNRMDKIWWNEQYMGWPVGPEYSQSSNVDNAYRLQGKLMLVVGELDTNVDPSSTYQVANALIKAGKTFDFLFLPGMGHTEGGTYGERRRWDFFVKELLGVTPIDRNAPKPEGAPPAPPRPPVPAVPPSSQVGPRAG